MKTIELFGVKTNIDTQKIGAGIHALHIDKGSETMLAFGMLDAELMELAETQMQTKLEDVYRQKKGDIFHDEITEFVKECMNEITKEVYRNSKMVV